MICNLLMEHDLSVLNDGSAFNHCVALNSLLCADVPLRTYTLTHSLSPFPTYILYSIYYSTVWICRTLD